MQTTNVRYLCLITVLLGGAGLFAVSGEPLGAGSARWPMADDLYLVQPWSVGGEVVEPQSNHTDLITRIFRHPDGSTASLAVLSNQAPKLYAAGPEVPFLGSGYSVQPATDDLGVESAGDGVRMLVAQQGAEHWVVMYAYGERRGLLGNGPLPWTLAVVDGILAKPNDYYKLYLTARNDQLDPRISRDVAELAHGLFPRIAAWYAT